MRISEMLKAIASWLESPNNEAIMLAEYDDQCLNVVADSCVHAAALLRNAADHVDEIEPLEDSSLTAENLEGLAGLAEALDSSDDEALKKQASVIDELLLTIAANPSILTEKKAAEDRRIEDLKKKYHPAKDKNEEKKIADAQKAIENSGFAKEYKILESPLSTRYCPDHAGAQISRVGDNVWQCELDKKTYDFANGFELMNGSKVPGGNVENQTNSLNHNYEAIFDSREGRLQQNN